MHTIREALAEGSASLAAASVESFSLDASLFLAEVLGMSRTSLLAAGSDQISEEILTAFRCLIKRRIKGECAAYILGRKEFFGLEIMVNPSVLVPRPETEILAEAALERLNSKEHQSKKNCQPVRVLDLCTGSGAVAIALKHTMPELEVWACDISAEALKTAGANAARLLPPDSIRFFQSNLFDALPSSPSFTVIASNPPYIPDGEVSTLAESVSGYEPHEALKGGADGMDFHRKIAKDAHKYMKDGGTLLLEIGYNQADDVSVILKENNFKNIEIYKDLAGLDRVAEGQVNNVR